MIYGFRGSEVDKVAEFAHEHNMTEYVLGQNYRSSKTIVSASRQVIANNVSLFDKTIFTSNEEGEPIYLLERETQKNEADAIAAKIKRCISEGYQYSDIAILYRMSYLSRKIEDSFLQQHIPYNMISGTPFYERMEIKDLLSYLRFITNPRDQISFERCIDIPKRHIGEVSLNKILSCQDDLSDDIMNPVSLLDACRTVGLKGKAKSGLTQFLAVCDKLLEDCEVVSPKALISELMDLINYDKYLKNYDKDSYEDRKGNIEELLNIASEHSNLTEFLTAMSISTTGDDEEEDSDRVAMMTMHASKGLEFPVVFVVGMNENICPHWKSVKAMDISEERRLFYVAMTRAKKRLFVTNPRKIVARGIPQEAYPSRFIGEIPEEYALSI